MSTVPDCRAIKRAEGSGMDLRMILSTLGLVAPVVVVAFEHESGRPLVQLTNLRPVPTGCRPIWSLCSAIALGERIGQSQRARLFASGA